MDDEIEVTIYIPKKAIKKSSMGGCTVDLSFCDQKLCQATMGDGADYESLFFVDDKDRKKRKIIDKMGNDTIKGWIPASVDNLPNEKVIYKLSDGTMGIGKLFVYEFFYGDRSVCVQDDYGGQRVNVIEWAYLPDQLIDNKCQYEKIYGKIIRSGE